MSAIGELAVEENVETPHDFIRRLARQADLAGDLRDGGSFHVGNGQVPLGGRSVERGDAAILRRVAGERQGLAHAHRSAPVDLHAACNQVFKDARAARHRNAARKCGRCAIGIVENKKSLVVGRAHVLGGEAQVVALEKVDEGQGGGAAPLDALVVGHVVHEMVDHGVVDGAGVVALRGGQTRDGALARCE